MGILISRFRKKKTTIEILEDLDTKIKEIEKYGQSTEQRHKKIVGTLIVYSVALYILTAIIFYSYFFPASLYDQLFYITPLLIFPILILFTKKMVTWYYKRKLSRNQSKLITMEDEKKKILDEVTETETYKKAKEILMKFAPDQLKMTPPTTVSKVVKSPETPRRPSTPQAIVPPLPGAGELRRRALTVSNLSSNKQTGRLPNTGPVPVGVTPTYTPLARTPFQSTARPFNTPSTDIRATLPRPILPQTRSYLDRLVEYLVGDGPSNRYALICRQCESHNGMALKEEFEYFGFRCCYCNFWNPARKQKPSAPKLEHDSSFALKHDSSLPFNSPATMIKQADVNVTSPKVNESLLPMETVESEAPAHASDSDSDIEVVEKSVEINEVTDDIFKEANADNKVEAPDPLIKELNEAQEDKKVVELEQMEVDESPKK